LRDHLIVRPIDLKILDWPIELLYRNDEGDQDPVTPRFFTCDPAKTRQLDKALEQRSGSESKDPLGLNAGITLRFVYKPWLLFDASKVLCQVSRVSAWVAAGGTFRSLLFGCERTD
jgi:hypothetical protein